MQLSAAMQVQAKAIADPTRFRIFEFISAASEPVGVPELTELLGFNHNAIRQHLALLVEAGVVVESTEQRKVRGRPRKLYGVRDDALAAFGSVSGSYEQLADLLLAVVASGDEPFEVGRASAAAQVSAGDADESTAADSVFAQLATAGFEPSATEAGQITLHHCPFADVATQNPGVVCELHRGLIVGHLQGIGSIRSSALEARDPHRAGCLVHIGEPETVSS